MMMNQEHINWVKEQLARSPDDVLRKALHRYEYYAANGATRRQLEEVASFVAERMQVVMHTHHADQRRD